MTDYPDFNHGLFNKVTHKLRAEGHQVINPAEAFEGDTTKTWEQYMRTGLYGLMSCDVVYALPEWHRSVGARLEVAVALSIGMDIFYYDESPISIFDRRNAVGTLIGMDD